MAEFKKGDRVKVEAEGVVAGEDGLGGAYLKVGTKGAYIPEALENLTLIERPVEPLAPGSVVVRDTPYLRDTFLVTRTGVFRVGQDGDVPDSSHTALSLAENVAQPYGGFTLIHDGSNK